MLSKRRFKWLVPTLLLLLLFQHGCTSSSDKQIAAVERAYQEGNYNQALALADAILKESPKSFPAHRLSALSYIAQGSPSAALDGLELVEKRHPEIAEKLLGAILLAIVENSLKSENFFVRSAAVKAVGEMGDRDLIPLIIPSMRDENSFVRFFAVESFGQLGGLEALKLIMAGGADRDGMVRIAAVKVLDEMGKKNEAGVDINNLLATFTGDQDVAVRLFALAGMAKYGDEKAFSKMMQEIEKLEAGALAAGIAALGRSQKSEAAPFLKKYLESSDQALRMYAAEAMGELALPELYSVLASALEDEDNTVRAAAATSLGKIGDKKAIPLLKKLTADPDAIVRVSAAEGLKRLGEKQPDIYRAALTEKDYGIRHFALGSLRRIWGAEGVEIMKIALKDPAPRVRTAAIRAIGEVGGREHASLLKALLRDPDPAVRTYAAGNTARILNRASGKKLRRSVGE